MSRHEISVLDPVVGSSHSRKPRSAPWTTLALAALALSGLIACSGSQANEADAGGVSAPSAGEAGETEAELPRALVRVLPVEPTAWDDAVELSAELSPWAAVTVAAETAGLILDLPVEHGDRVRQGQVLARLETNTVAAEVAQAEARVASAEAALAQAARDLERGRALADADRGIVSKDDVERWTLSRDTRNAELAEAEAALQMVRERLDNMEIRAPFAGIVSERHVERGSWVAVGSPVFRLVASDRLKARASITSTDRLRVGLEDAAEFRFDAGGYTVPAKLRFLGQEADPSTATFLVEAEVPASTSGSGPSLLAGLQGTLRVVIETRQGIVIPRTAVLSTSDGDHVFVVEDGKAARRSVELAVIDGRRGEVLAGLVPGDRLVTQGQHRLSDGQAVEEQGS